MHVHVDTDNADNLQSYISTCRQWTSLAHAQIYLSGHLSEHFEISEGSNTRLNSPELRVQSQSHHHEEESCCPELRERHFCYCCRVGDKR